MARDECWHCGGEIEKGDLLVEIRLVRAVTEDKRKSTRGGLFSLACLGCAKDEIVGINEDNLEACAPRDWKKHLTKLVERGKEGEGLGAFIRQMGVPVTEHRAVAIEPEGMVGVPEELGALLHRHPPKIEPSSITVDLLMEYNKDLK